MLDASINVNFIKIASRIYIMTLCLTCFTAIYAVLLCSENIILCVSNFLKIPFISHFNVFYESL